jgi:hypothetical protein
MSVNHDLIPLDFKPFHIFSAHGRQYCGIRPSEILKPFKSATVVLGGGTYQPGIPEGYTQKQVIGYDAAIRVGINITSSGEHTKEDRAYRLITLLADGRKWSKLIFLNGNVQEDWF